MFLSPDMIYVNKPGILIRNDGQRLFFSRKSKKSRTKTRKSRTKTRTKTKTKTRKFK